MLRAAKKKGYRLSLSVNTDFKGALEALREHHEDEVAKRLDTDHQDEQLMLTTNINQPMG